VLVEARYVAPFVVLFILGLLMLAQLPKTTWHLSLIGNVCLVLVTTLALQIGWILVEPVTTVASQLRHGTLLEADEQAQVAAALRAAGVQPGDPVATGDRGFNAYWARLARVRIVAEVSGLNSGDLLAADAVARQTTQQALLAQEARVVVAHGWPELTGDPHWQRAGSTSYFFYVSPTPVR
jgi:hypothetical protein